MPNNFDKLFNQAQGNELINALKGIKSSLDVNYPLETVNVTLSNNAQNITPSANYYGLGQVNVPGMNLSDMTILVNGNYDPVTSGLDGYGKLNVNVPTWSQADEGKVVSNNALVPQTNREVNANGTYDTTLNNSVLVNVPNTYGSEDEGKVIVNNALVPQTNRSITENGTYDTTTNDEVVVDVQGGSVLIPKTITQNGSYDPTDDNADGYNNVIVNVEGGGEAEPALPSAYQRIEYLDFTPSIGIVVTIPTQSLILFTADFSSDKVSEDDSIVFGYRLSSTNDKDFELAVRSNALYSFLRRPGNTTGMAQIETNSYTAGDRVQAHLLLKEPRSTALIGKYAYYSSVGVNDLAFDGKFYSLKGKDILTDRTVVWFVPCYRKSDNQVGVYDHISQEFYYETYQVGSSYSIVAGPDVNS